MTAIRCERVSKSYRAGPTLGLKERLVGKHRRQGRFVREHALNDISFEVPTSSSFGVVGPNGSGKTTLLGLLLGVLSPDHGTVEVHGRIASMLALGAGFHPELTGRQNVFLYGSILGMTMAETRLAYRDIASATNRLTLIAAVIPPRAVTTHTLFCLKTPLPADAQHVLCALLNSLVANYLIRLRVNTHVTVALVSRLPAPVVRRGDPAFTRLAALSRALTDGRANVEEMREYTELQALVAQLYELTESDFEHVLATFPLIPAQVRARTLLTFRDLL